ncbi:hypothetical protein [Bacillus sp. FJAT-47783]|uniref:hypothetical protein n=1 Tax=Bacillus sp. FJAT-47783 TaxID=2922712 RepID=UPI001FAC2CED|nr:hypothetical protein [Bacillus sp. FJAT-47783]
MHRKRSNIVNPVPLTFKCISPKPDRKKGCCTFILEHRTQLVPPAKKGSTKVKKELFAEIEKVCHDAVIICGFLRKTITYTAVINGEKIKNTIFDEVPFQCLIDNVNAMEGDKFKIVEKKIVCEVFGEEANFGKDNQSGCEVAFKFKEKDVVKICVIAVKKEKC